MLHKSFEILESKADAEAGTFEATVAIFGNVDKGGDRIMPPAFDKTLAAWRAAGDPIPVILSHSWNDPFHHIGIADPEDVTPTPKGLHVKGKLDIADNDVARQVHRLMARRSLKEFSFGYSVPKGGEKRGKDGANELWEIDLAEVGPTLKGMNPATELHSVKSALEGAATSALAQEVKDLKARLEKLEKAVEKGPQEARKAAPDSLKDDAMKAALEVLTGGVKPPMVVTTQERPPGPDIDPEALKRSSRDLMLTVLTGVDVT